MDAGHWIPIALVLVIACLANAVTDVEATIRAEERFYGNSSAGRSFPGLPAYTIQPNKAVVVNVNFVYPEMHQTISTSLQQGLSISSGLKHIPYDLQSLQSFQPEHALETLIRPKISNADRNLSSTCEAQLHHLLDSLTISSKNQSDLWAAKMLDSWGRPEPGLLSGVLNWLGDYAECTAARSSYNESISQYQGKYCTGMHPTQQLYNGKNITITYQMGLCVPSGCGDRDAALFYDAVLSIISTSPELPAVACQPIKKEWSTASIATYVVYGLVFLLCVLSSLYDYSIHGTLMYYMVYRLPIPQNLTPHKKTIHTDDDGNLIQNMEEEEEGEYVPKIHKFMSGHEFCWMLSKRFFLQFSFYTNGYKLLSSSQPPGAIHCIHGIRFLSLSWVILGHTLVFSMQNIATMTVILDWIKRFTFQTILNASVSVDSFFLLSGILATYLMLREFSRRQLSGVVELLKITPVLYLHRYLRLTPALGFMLLFYMYGVYNLSEGPMYLTAQPMDVNCKNNSWANLLYINNIYMPDHECAAWTWYLANDFQFYMVTPFIAALLYWSGKLGIALTTGLVIISCGSAMGVTALYDLGLSLMNPNTNGGGAGGGLGNFLNGHWFGDFYVTPWVRFQSYGVGIIYGYIIWKTNGQLHINRLTNLFLWMIAFVLLALPVYGAYHSQKDSTYVPSAAENIAFNGLTRTSWCLGLGYVVLACHSGRGGWISELLSWRGFVPLSRLTYCAYLLHPLIMTVVNFSAQSLTRITDIELIFMFLKFMFASYSIAFVFSLMFEIPMRNVLNAKLLIQKDAKIQ